jgi:hypothetical protein
VRALSRLAALVAAVAACGDDAGTSMPDANGDVDGDIGPDADIVEMTEVPTGCVADRVTSDRADDSPLDQIRFLYVVPSDGADRAYDTGGKICNSVRAVATWFHAQTDSYVRIDTQGGLIDIGFVRLTKTDVQMRGNDPNNNTIDNGTAFVRERIERELDTMGLIASNKLYGVYYDGTSTYACGGGAYPPLIKERVGAMYLKAIPIGLSQACGDTLPWGQPSLVPNYIDYGILHELVHSMGIVSMSSPHQHTSGHVYDLGAAKPSSDLMYSPRPSMADPGWATTSGLVIDINSDDYYHAGESDLATTSLLSPLPANAVRPIGW